jgi:hypothetical protein
MLAKLRARLTYANVMATIAVFVALGGSSYAAITITGKNVKNRSLTGRDIKKNSLTSAEVRDQTLLAKDFEAGQLPAGPKGDKGDRGVKGDRGLQGPAGPSQGFAGATASDSFVDSTPDGVVSQTTFNLAQPGRLYVQARGIVAVTCSPSETSVFGGIYVDGNSATTYTAFAAASGQRLATGNGSQVNFAAFGITPSLSSGNHTISYRTDCPIGSATTVSASGSDGAIGAILVGP